MRRWLFTLAALIAVAPACLAMPLDPALQQQLLGIYDGYNKALLAGKMPDAMKLRTAAIQAEAQKEMPTAAARQRFLEMARTMVPDSLQVVHATINAAGDKVNIITVAAKTIPKNVKLPPGGPAPGSTVHSEVTLSFAKEKDGWKLDDQTFGFDPATIKACKDDKYEPESAYDTDRTVSMGGPIVRVDFQSDHTLVVIRVTDEEDCVFLPDSKEGLLKHGLAADKLVPYAIVEIEGSPHKTDKQKVLANKLNVEAEE
jgi:hypothetical protein